jgi:hypothetical protein
MTLRRYWSTAACQGCAIKSQCTPSKERRITRWEHEHVVEEVQRRLDSDSDAMRRRRETVEHPFGTIKARMGATHFLMKRLRNVAAEMALHVLAYNLTRVINIVGKPSLQPLRAALRPESASKSALPLRDTYFGQSLNYPTREPWQPAVICDHGRVPTYPLHTTKTQGGTRTGVAQLSYSGSPALRMALTNLSKCSGRLRNICS